MRISDCGLNKKDLQDRTKAFAVAVLALAEQFPRSVSGRTVANQLARSGTEVAANYRAACRAKSKADFISKMGTVEEEADESLFWLELAVDASLLSADDVGEPHREGEELLKIAVASIITARTR